MNYSILMSVYYKENPEYLKQAIESMLNQTIKSNDFVIVCDGMLTDELYKVLDFYESNPENCIHKLQLDRNYGLGIALNKGLEVCKNELIARMDSDDISIPYRCEIQIKKLLLENLSIVGSNVKEFLNSPNNIIGERKVPNKYKDILRFSKKRNPFNHPTVMFKKTAIKEVGSYLEDFHLFEDYHLWIRVISKGYYCENIDESLVLMRTSYDMYYRRGGILYANEMIRFRRWLKQYKWINIVDFITSAIPHYIICIFPNCIRKHLYLIIRKKH